MDIRTYRLILGALLLVSLYFDLGYLMHALIGILFFEGITNLRLPSLAQKLWGGAIAGADKNQAPPHRKYRFNFEAERAWCLVVGSMLFITYVLFYDLLWFFPWFMGFAIFGAGVSGVCPVQAGLKWAGCK
jgi:hypothetical protein